MSRKSCFDRQVMMFSATLSSDTRDICKKFMQGLGPCILHSCPYNREVLEVLTSEIRLYLKVF